MNRLRLVGNRDIRRGGSGNDGVGMTVVSFEMMAMMMANFNDAMLVIMTVFIDVLFSIVMMTVVAFTVISSTTIATVNVTFTACTGVWSKNTSMLSIACAS